jgi:hypothetical protein
MMLPPLRYFRWLSRRYARQLQPRQQPAIAASELTPPIEGRDTLILFMPR